MWLGWSDWKLSAAVSRVSIEKVFYVSLKCLEFIPIVFKDENNLSNAYTVMTAFEQTLHFDS